MKTVGIIGSGWDPEGDKDALLRKKAQAHILCSNISVPTNFDCCGGIKQIDRIYFANGCFSIKKPKTVKPRRIKIKGKQYARPFYVWEAN